MPPNRNILIGVFVLGGFFLFALGLFWIGDRRLLFSESLELQTGFANVSGLRVGAKVMVSGMDAGEVLLIQVPPRPGAKFNIRFRVLERFTTILRADSVASIQVEGLVGNKILQVDAGSDGAPEINDGDTIPSREPLEIAAVIQQAVDMIEKVDNAVEDVQQKVGKTIDTLTELGEEAQSVVTEVGRDTGVLIATSRDVANDVRTIVEGVRAGRGTIGKLVNDDRVFDHIRGSLTQVEGIATNARETSEKVNRILADLERRDIGDKVEKTAANLAQATARVNEVMDALRPEDSENQGMLVNMQRTLDNARDATAGLAENMEALKHNWLFRGFFRNRGFFDLDSLSRDDYVAGRIAPERKRERVWLQAHEIFATKPDGAEILSPAGIEKLNDAMIPYLRYAPNTLIIVEGYSSQGTEDLQFLHSRERARLVREHLIRRFGLKPAYTGAVPMGGVRSESGTLWNGVAIVAFIAPDK
jgi:phospholipid/cholesterol/gamma-HCH transport system substrate-binding protein